MLLKTHEKWTMPITSVHNSLLSLRMSGTSPYLFLLPRDMLSCKLNKFPQTIGWIFFPINVGLLCSHFSVAKNLLNIVSQIHTKKCPQHHYLKNVHQKPSVHDKLIHRRPSRRHQHQRLHRDIRFRLWIEWRRNVRASNETNRQIDGHELPILSSAAAT